MNKGVLMSKRARLGLLTLIVGLLWVFIPERTQSPKLPDVPIMIERTKATMEEKRENKALTISFLKALGYNEQQRECAVTLWTRESRFDHLARPRDSSGKPISSAFGIAQLLRERSGEPELQILHGIRYVEHRYRGSFCSAKRHSDLRNWY
jgi:hypothetical protein